MTKSRATEIQQAFTKMPCLILPRNTIEIKLRERIDSGRQLQGSPISNEIDLKSRRDEHKKWHEYNTEYLRRCFDISSIADKYAQVPEYGALRMNASFYELIDSFKDGIGKRLTELESILERLELIPESNDAEEERSSFPKNNSNSVFIVHGHDDEAKNKVARFIEKLGLEAIILHEHANEGKTIIEKFEAHAINAGFAVVLLTPDDVGASKDTEENLNPRARQNVILELGYFCGLLGRNRVCVLFKEGVEMPSDYLGVIYTPLDSSDGWHLKLAKEMKVAGLDIDLNKAI